MKAARGARSSAQPVAPAVVWHDLECGCYEADLALWHELAERNRGPVLEVGAGTGRVALALAAAGRSVTALELDPVLLTALRERAAGSSLRAVCADARSFALERRDFALCIVPMQAIQLFGRSEGRAAFLGRARLHLRPGGLLACALVEEVEPFDCADGEGVPPPESVRANGALYVSCPTRVSVLAHAVRIERERKVLATGAPPAGDGQPAELALETDVVLLDRLSASQLEREGRALGLRAEPAREVPSTAEHGGSVVVMLRA